MDDLNTASPPDSPRPSSDPGDSPSSVPPDYLPARMLNEFVYCPRLFYYEWVDGLFVESRDTVAGTLRHEKLERKEDALPSPEAVADGKTIHSRSVTLSDDTHRLIAKLDLIEGEDGLVTPVDYKIGAPRRNDADGEITVWDADRVQLGAQALVLRGSGYRCEDGVIYYVATKQRVRISVDDDLVRKTLDALRRARETASGPLPPPLVDSPKCPRCSLVGVCLPDETRVCAGITGSDRDNGNPAVEIRRLVPARDDLKPLYLNSQGFRVGKSGEVLQIHGLDKKVQEVRFNEVSQLNLFGNVQISTQAIQALCTAEIPISYFSQGGWFYATTHGLGMKNIELRRRQFRAAEHPTFCLDLSRALVIGKIKNQRTLLLRNHIEPPRRSIALLKELQTDAERAPSIDVLLGVEGYAARAYFEHFVGMIKVGDQASAEAEAKNDDADDSEVKESDGDCLMTLFLESAKNHPAPTAAVPELRDEGHVDSDELPAPDAGSESPASRGRRPSPFRFDFTSRNRRPPLDPINALLSLAYSVLAKDLTIVCHAVGFDPYLGFYHQPRFGRSSLALDLMEPFRPLIADSVVINAINTRMVSLKDFIQVGPAMALTPNGRKGFFRAYEQRMDTLVTHPLFGYRVSYRRILEIQVRLLARLLEGEIGDYPVFTTR